MKTTRDNSMRNCKRGSGWRERYAAIIQISACALTHRLNLHVLRCGCCCSLSFVAENNIELVRLGGAAADDADGQRDGGGGAGSGGGGSSSSSNKDSKGTHGHGSTWKPTSEVSITA